MKVNKEIIITSKREIDINILAIIFDILDELDLNNQLEGIKELTDYILSRKKRKNKLK